MFSLATQEFDQQFEFEGIKGMTDLAFDNVLRMFELIKDNSYNVHDLMLIAICLVTDLDYIELSKESDEKLQRLLQYLLDNFITKSKPILTAPSQVGKKPKEYYDIVEDAGFIYASFLQDYHIDLFKVQGRLHWYQFRALLDGLSDDTKFKQVVSIRQQKTHVKGMSKEEKRNIKDLQTVYALHVTEQDVEFSKLDLEERDEYLKQHPDYAAELERLADED